MSAKRRQLENERRMRRRDRQVFPGNPAAASATARQLGAGAGVIPFTAGTGGIGGGVSTSSAPEMLRWTASGDAIASGGDTVAFDTEVNRLGFSTSSTPGATFTGPFDGIATVVITVNFAAHTAGAAVSVRSGGYSMFTRPADTFRTSTYAEVSATFEIFKGQTYEVHLAHSAGSDQTANVSLDVLALRRTLGPPPPALEDPLWDFSLGSEQNYVFRLSASALRNYDDGSTIGTWPASTDTLGLSALAGAGIIRLSVAPMSNKTAMEYGPAGSPHEYTGLSLPDFWSVAVVSHVVTKGTDTASEYQLWAFRNGGTSVYGSSLSPDATNIDQLSRGTDTTGAQTNAAGVLAENVVQTVRTNSSNALSKTYVGDVSTFTDVTEAPGGVTAQSSDRLSVGGSTDDTVYYVTDVFIWDYRLTAAALGRIAADVFDYFGNT